MRRFVELGIVAALAAAIAACGDGGGDTQAVDAAPPPTTCTLSADCGSGRWCNPGTSMCEQRSSVVNFDRDLYPMIRDVCVACHMPGGVGSKDVNGVGAPLIYSGGPDVAYANLVAGGTTCSGPGKGRVCVNEPMYSLGVIRVTPQDGDAGVSFFVFPEGLKEPWVQSFMRWAAAGARRDPVPDGGIVDASVPVVYDAPRPPVDAPAGVVFDAPAGVVFDAPLPPDAAIVYDAPPPPPDAPLGPDAANPDLTSPTGGDVTAASSDACGQVTLTIQAGSDDRTPADMLRYEVCWGPAAGSCTGVGFVARATFTAPGTQVVDVSDRDGTTQFFAGRVVDLSNNRSTPSQTKSAAIPSFLSWAAGSVAIEKTGQPGSYSVTWPLVSSTCPSKGPLSVTATCTGATCSCVVAANQQSATCTATTCDAIDVAVKASAGRSSTTRSRGFTMRFNEVDHIYDDYGCRSCHAGLGYPMFTTADVGTVATNNCKAQGDVYISAGSPANSMIYGVATTKTFLCGGTHINFGTMSTADTETLRCWIQGGALP